MKTAVIYARYSSDLQKDRSIDDQIAQAQQLATRHGYRVVEVYSDRAKSGASMFERDGLLALMTAAKQRKFQGVIVESLSRLSRDQEDTAAIYKRLTYNDITIIDVNGAVGDVHVGVGGIVNSMFRKNLSISVKRGHKGHARDGLIPGNVLYGYRLIPGKPGEREIDPENAEIVRRIFREYAAGHSPRDIARRLNEDGIASPRGGQWSRQMISAYSHHRRGMIGNTLYIGKLVWCASYAVMDPETGRYKKRKSSADELVYSDVPHLRIIDQDLWDRAVAVASGKATVRKRPAANHDTRKNHLLGGLLTCASCGRNMIVMQTTAGDARVGCSVAYRQDTCGHRRSYSLKALQAVVLDGVKANLTNTEALVEYTKAYHARWAERQREVSVDRDKVQRDLSRVTVQIDRYVTAIGDSEEPIPAMMAKLKVLEAERVALVERLRLIDQETGGAKNVVSLHPAAIDAFRDNIEALHTALTSDLSGDELAPFRGAFRNVFDRIVIHPTEAGKPYEVTPYARLSAIIGVELFPQGRTTEQMLAEQGVAASSISAGEDYQACRNQTEGVISLGLWKQAA